MKMIMIIIIVLCAFAASAQSYVEDKSGNIVKKEKTASVKTADPIVAVKDGITFYRGAKGGVYYWKTKKNGEKYKCYVPKQK